MSSFKVTAEQLTIHPHPNADALELAQVGGYRAVVAKGSYRTGDWAIYIPEQAVLPDGLIDELGLTGKLAGSKKNRVKPVRLRGELSQGIVCRPAALAEVDLEAANADAVDFADTLGVEKWLPPIPAQMNGQLVAAPDLLPWVDIENIKRFADIFSAGEPVIATEKIHGTCCLASYIATTGALFVSSKGYGSRRTAIVESDRNVYWQAVRANDVDGVACAVAAELDAVRVGIFGEVFGAGIQDLHYGVDRARRGYAVFDVAYDLGDGVVRWVDADTLETLVAGRLPLAPVVYVGAYDEAALRELATGSETISGTASHLREGLVVRPAKERYSPVTGGRAVAKFVSDDYLTRSGGTEFE